MAKIHNLTYVKYVARLAKLCNCVLALVVVLKQTKVGNVDAVIEYNSKLISQLQELQRTLIYFKNANRKTSVVPEEGPDAS